MAEIGLLYDQSETDELGIKLTAKNMNIDIVYLPFFKTSFTFNKDEYRYRTLGKDYTKVLKDVKVVLNRCQSKNRRQYASAILENLDKHVLNPQIVEYNCYSKIRTLLAFASAGINIPKTLYISSNVKESVSSGGIQDYTGYICSLIEKELSKDIVIKPDAGTQGKGVSLSRGRKELEINLDAISPGTVNPSGILAQEYIPKWFYDLRIIVVKKKGSPPFCYENALARGNLREFRTNTFLGSMVFRAKLPKTVRATAEKCAGILGRDQDAWVIALDAMPEITPELMQDEKQLKNNFEALEKPFSKVKNIKNMPRKKQRFKEYTQQITRAYREYMETESYKFIESIVNKTLRKTADKVYFHEGNACPEFWEQTRVVAGINLAEDLLYCALSLMDS